MDWAVDHLEKEIPVGDVFDPNEIVDAIGVTKGKGFKGKFFVGLDVWFVYHVACYLS